MMNVRPQGRFDRGLRWGWRLVARVDSHPIRRASFLIVACWFLSNPPKALSLNEESVEYPVKLGFLYNFTKFVEWPPNSYPDRGSPLAICIVGDDPFSSVLLGQLRTRTVGGHPVEVRELKSNDTLSVCQMVFVPGTEKNHVATIVRNLKGSSTLTVGETEGFAEQGGIINLTVEENKVHFEVNPLAAERAGLKISSKLLSIAKIVKEQDHGSKS
jgi:YfiR/HmsC-like